MIRMTFHVAEDVAEAVRQDAERKGQSLSVWFLRTAIAALQPEADAPVYTPPKAYGLRKAKTALDASDRAKGRKA
jgi:hypothetical protein